jgi:hypothetical protein
MVSVVKVRPYEAGDASRWNAFVFGCPDATFFHRIEWRDIMESVFRHRTHYLLAERDGQIVAVLPLVEVKSRLFGHAMTSLPFAVYGGIAGSDAEAVDALDEAADALSRKAGVQHLEYRNLTERHPEWPRQEVVTFRKEILADEEANMLAIPASSGRWCARASRTASSARSTATSTASSRCTPTTCCATARRRCRNVSLKP